MPDDAGSSPRSSRASRRWGEDAAARHPRHRSLHAANSAATLRDPAAHFDLVRCGVADLRDGPLPRGPGARGLEPALELRSYVADLKPLRAGRERRLRAALRRRARDVVAVLPIGYGDGVRRGLTNNAEVLVAGAAIRSWAP